MTESQGKAAADFIKVERISRIFGHGASAVYALREASISFPAKRLIVLRGRSGSGKTTLINMLGVLDRPSEGRIYMNGEEIGSLSEKRRNELRRRHMGLIFQSFGLVPLMSAYENVEFGLRIAGVPRSSFQEFAERALEVVGMKARMKHRPFELSGGEQQRVAIARAIAHKPSIILADEPTAELDSKMGQQVMKVFRELVSAEGMTVIITTHDLAVMKFADQVYEMEDGRIVDHSS
jgi:putative ABC transport system ATP-binding protein